MRQGTVPGGKPHRDGALALAFHTLLSFQGTSPGCSSATHLRFPRPVTAGAAGRYHGPFKIVKDFPPARSAYSWWSTTCHVDTFTQKRRPAPGPAGRQDGHRTAVGRILLALGDLLSSDADAAGVVPERSSVSKNFPACSLETVAPDSTACQLAARCRIPAATTVPAGRLFPGVAQDEDGPGGGWRRHGERRPTVSRRPSSSASGQLCSTESTGLPSRRTAPCSTRRRASP